MSKKDKKLGSRKEKLQKLAAACEQHLKDMGIDYEPETPLKIAKKLIDSNEYHDAAKSVLSTESKLNTNEKNIKSLKDKIVQKHLTSINSSDKKN